MLPLPHLRLLELGGGNRPVESGAQLLGAGVRARAHRAERGASHESENFVAAFDLTSPERARRVAGMVQTDRTAPS